MEIIAAAIGTNIAPEALSQLMALQERWESNESRKAYNRAMVAAQGEMPTIYKGRKGQKSSYASYDDIMRVVRPVLDKNGLALSYTQSETETSITLVCSILHVDGHTHDVPFTLPKDDLLKTKDGRAVTNLAQAQGSANSYAKRYCVCNALNIVVGDMDDDAKAMDAPVQEVTAEQAAELEDLCERSGADVEKVFRHYAIESFRTTPITKFPKVRNGLTARLEAEMRKTRQTGINTQDT